MRFIAAFALWLCAAMPAFAQNRENLPVIGILRINTPDTVEPFATGFKEALAALGLVDGRNIRLEILKEIVPSGRRFALMCDPATKVQAQLQAIADVAHALGVELQTVDLRVPTDLPPAFASFRAGGAEAIDVLSSPILFGSREELGRLSLTYKLPAICEWRQMAEAGCVASYGYSSSEGWAMLAALTDKMLKGARPGDTPAQQPTRFELVINRKVARAIGIEIPPAVLGRADEVIE